jgi:hypothetical protein
MHDLEFFSIAVSEFGLVVERLSIAGALDGTEVYFEDAEESSVVHIFSLTFCKVSG